MKGFIVGLLSQKNYALIISNIVLFLSLVVSAFILVRLLIKNNIVNVISGKLKKSEEVRIMQEEALRVAEGNQDKTNFFYKMDLMINQSGLRKHYKGISTEIICMLSMLMSMTGLVSTLLITQSGFLSIIVFITLLFFPYITLAIIADFNRKKVEAQIIHFLNMVENYTRTYDNIITIFGKIYPFLQEPMCSAVKECYVEATNTGNVSAAFRKLETKVVHDKFSEILRNLELCGKYEANYQLVVSQARDIMINYIKSKKKIKNIVNDAKLDFIILLISGVFLVGIIDSFIDNGSLLSILTNGPVGFIIIAYNILVAIYSIVTLVSLTRL